MKVLKIRYCINRELRDDDEPVEITQSFHFHFLEYVTDEQGRQGAKFRAEGSSGYDFRYADEDFTLFPGDTYTGIWSYESGDGPSDWEEVSYCYTVQLVEADE